MASANEYREEWLAGRAFFYQLAHTVFSGEPNETLIAVLASDECRDALRGASEISGEAVRALADFCDDLPEGEADRAAVVEKALSEYNRVVAGLGSNRESHPWESAYTSSKKLLFQVETLEVRNAYRAFGYLPELYPKVADDHIALECAFLAALAGKMLAAADADADLPTAGDEGSCADCSSDSEQCAECSSQGFAQYAAGSRGFLRDHLLRWIDDYAAGVREDAPGGLYDLTAAALAEFAHADVSLLNDALGE